MSGPVPLSLFPKTGAWPASLSATPLTGRIESAPLEVVMQQPTPLTVAGVKEQKGRPATKLLKPILSSLAAPSSHLAPPSTNHMPWLPSPSTHTPVHVQRRCCCTSSSGSLNSSTQFWGPFLRRTQARKILLLSSRLLEAYRAALNVQTSSGSPRGQYVPDNRGLPHFTHSGKSSV